MSEFSAFEQQMMVKDFTEQQKMMFLTQYNATKKDGGTVLVLSLFSLDRFLLGQVGLGILKLITFGGFGLWWLVDIFSTKSRTGDFNRARALEIAAMIKSN